MFFQFGGQLYWGTATGRDRERRKKIKERQ
jgi:hypothetical protein